jgi:hypothetical protein
LRVLLHRDARDTLVLFLRDHVVLFDLEDGIANPNGDPILIVADNFSAELNSLCLLV